MKTTVRPRETLEEIGQIGTQLLQDVIAIDSQSDEHSPTIPSTEGQKALSSHLSAFFENLGYSTAQDEYANLLVHIPATKQQTNDTKSQPGSDSPPKVVFMVHMDTSRGTNAVSTLERIPNWDGSRIHYSLNQNIEVALNRFPQTKPFLNQDLLHGPGDAPIGLDDKLGMAEMMTMAKLLATNPQIEHGDLLLACRPDEEIGRMEAVEGLAEALRDKGVTHGYTIDGISPFEVNIENFNAASADVRIPGEPLDLDPMEHNWHLELLIEGAKSHGATAKAEGYLNPTRIFLECIAPLSRRQDLIPIGFSSDSTAETNATWTFLIRGETQDDVQRAKSALEKSLHDTMEKHRWKGVRFSEVGFRRLEDTPQPLNHVMRLFAHLATLMRIPGENPLYSEDSEVAQGYTNPFFVHQHDDHLVLSYRVRDFTTDGLERRLEHLKTVSQQSPGMPTIDVQHQYSNMGPKLKDFPELISWATDAAKAHHYPAHIQPIRGGTGVDPFLNVGIPIANLGTGYFAPESEKEFTSVQTLAHHVIWLVTLVQRIAQSHP